MSCLLICNKCGRIIFDSEIKVCDCKNLISISYNSYPEITAKELRSTITILKEDCDKKDKENKKEIQKLLKQYTEVDLDISTIDSYINIYEGIKEKYPYGDNSFLICDKFEDKLVKKDGMNPNLFDDLYSCVIAYSFNRYRKLVIITLASFIEILFYDCFNLLINTKLGDKGSKIFLKEYEDAGIQQCLDIISSFMNNPIDLEMNSFSNDFTNKWLEIRRLRNSIIHSNDKYISKVKLNRYYKLVDESVVVFSSLKSKIIKKEI